MEINRTECKCTNMKKQGIQRMVLYVVELLTNNKRFGDLIFSYLYIYTHTHTHMYIYIVSIYLNSLIQRINIEIFLSFALYRPLQ